MSLRIVLNVEVLHSLHVEVQFLPGQRGVLNGEDCG